MSIQKAIFLVFAVLLYFTSLSQGFYQDRKIVNSERRSTKNFGEISVTDGERIAISSDREIFIFKKDGNDRWTEEARIEGEGSINNQFGSAIAIYKDYLAVGANEDDRDSSGNNFILNSGAVFLFKRDTLGQWNYVQKLISPIRRRQDRFGISVALGDSTLLVGSYLHDFNPQGQDSISNAGAVFHYNLSTQNTWVLKQKIVASDRSEDDWFGVTTLLKGKDLLISSIKKDFPLPPPNFKSEAGAVYVFETDSSGQFIETQKILASDPERESLFGFAMDLDDSVMIIGAYNQPSTVNFTDDIGAAYIFEKDSTNQWVEANKLVPKDGEDIDRFGISVSISGGKAAVGAYTNDTDENGLNDISDAGAVYMVEKDYFDQWSIQQKIVSSDRSAIDRFGASVILDGTFLWVGAVNESGDSINQNPISNAGAIYTFKQCISNGLSYSPELNLLASNEDGASYQWANCIDVFAPIPQQNNQTFQVPTNGFYSVAVSKNGCSDTSACLWINCVSDSVFLINDTLFAFEENANYRWFKNDTGLHLLATETGKALHIKESGSYVLEVEKNGCVDTSITTLICLPLQLDLADNIITVSEPFAKYQWFNCDSNRTPLVGDTLQSYEVTADGLYRVAVNKNRCVDTSYCIYAECISTFIFKNLDTLTAFQANARYQWFKNDSTYELLPNDTNRTYVVLKNGKYAVEIRRKDCIDTSATINVTSVSLVERALSDRLKIYPNPTEQLLTISCESCNSSLEGILYNNSGKIMARFETMPNFSKQLDLNFLKSGIYFIELRSSEGIVRHKILKL